MKTIITFVIISLFLGLTGFQKMDKKEVKAKQRLEMAQLIQNGRFRFVARSANSDLGNFDNLSPNYDLTFDSLKVKAYLPYYGRVYTAPYGGAGGVKCDLKAKKIVNVYNEHKKIFLISTELEDSDESYVLLLNAGLDGYADLKITFSLNIDGFKYHEIAEKLDIPIGTVKTRIFVAKRKLRKQLHSYGANYGLLEKSI